MKHTEKGNSPDEFESWKALKNENWSPSFENLQNPEKQILVAALIKEQGGVCCYCGGFISEKNSHVEHFRPQALFPHLELEFNNLLASCIKGANKGDDIHCGHAKGEAFSDSFISPHELDCEARFKYTFMGEIQLESPGDEKAARMLDVLKLQHTSLELRRRQAILKVFNPEFIADVSDDELRKIRDKYRKLDDDGRLSSFSHVVAIFSEQYLPKA